MQMPVLLEMILGIVKITPWYVWGILGYILYIGIQSTQIRTIWIPRLFIIPAILIGLKVNNFLNADLITGISYLFCLAIGCIMGYLFISARIIEVNKKDPYIKLSGSYQTLLLLVLFFIIKYLFGFLKSTKPEIIQNYLGLEDLLSLLVSGYFLGNALHCFKRFFVKTYILD